MQALAGLFCFSLLLATGACLECEQCSAFKEDCTGKLEQCREGQDTCATILTETIIGKVSSFTIVKSCYQASKCLSSTKGYSFIKVNVNIECSSSPAGKVESEGTEHGSNELLNNQLPPEVINRLKSRAAEVLNLDNFKAVKNLESSVEPPQTTTKKPEPSVNPPKTTTKKPEPSVNPPKTTTKKPATTTKASTPKSTTGDAHQTVASFLLGLSSLLLMSIFL